MKRGDRIGIVCCSNGLARENAYKLEILNETLLQIGLLPVFSPYLYGDEAGFAGTGAERAGALMGFFRDGSIKGIFDISGGDMANELLPYLDFPVIAAAGKQLWGYSDLTAILNAIYARTGSSSVLYQIRNLTYGHSQEQIRAFSASVLEGRDDLFALHYDFLQGSHMEGVVAGGNIRCLLKLAGTPYWPDMQGKILLLEALGGQVPQMVTYLSQLSQMGVFHKINGILLGTFTKMEENGCRPSMPELVRRFAGSALPIARTSDIGHDTDAKAIIIGERLKIGD